MRECYFARSDQWYDCELVGTWLANKCLLLLADILTSNMCHFDVFLLLLSDTCHLMCFLSCGCAIPIFILFTPLACARARVVWLPLFLFLPLVSYVHANLCARARLNHIRLCFCFLLLFLTYYFFLFTIVYCFFNITYYFFLFTFVNSFFYIYFLYSPWTEAGRDGERRAGCCLSEGEGLRQRHSQNHSHRLPRAGFGALLHRGSWRGARLDYSRK